MILKLFRKSPAPDAVYAVYRAIVAQSRQPRFYAEWGVPDTVTGRFDMISLHMALLFRRLRADGTRGPEFSQALFDLFFRDMDRSLREMGAGDLAIPKKVQKMGNLFFGLMTSLNEAIERGDRAAVERVVRRNLFEDAETPHLSAMVDYLLSQDGQLATQPVDGIVAGRIEMAVAA